MVHELGVHAQARDAMRRAISGRAGGDSRRVCPTQHPKGLLICECSWSAHPASDAGIADGMGAG